jgi:rubredoxin
MASWKCTNCGYTFEADAPTEHCPSCKVKCEFVDISCYTPDCANKGVDERLGHKKKESRDG